MSSGLAKGMLILRILYIYFFTHCDQCVTDRVTPRKSDYIILKKKKNQSCTCLLYSLLKMWFLDSYFHDVYTAMVSVRHCEPRVLLVPNK